MNITRKHLARTALSAVAFSVLTFAAGCGKKQQKAYRPLAPEGTFIAAVEETKGLADNPMVQYCLDFQVSALEKCAAFAKEMGDDALNGVSIPEDSASLKQKQLDAMRRFDWMAFTMSKPDFNAQALVGDEPQVSFPNMAVVYAFAKPATFEDVEAELKRETEEFMRFADKHEDDDGIAEAVKLFETYCEVKDATIAGCPAKVVVVKRCEDTEGFLGKVGNFEPCYGLYDGRLLIAASSAAAFQEIVSLYSGEKAPSADPQIVEDFKLGNPNQGRFAVYGICDFIKDFFPEGDIDGLPEEAKPYARALDTVKFRAAYDGEKMESNCGIDISLRDESLAPVVVSMFDGVKGMVNLFAAGFTVAMPSVAPLLNIFNRTTVTADGGKCSLNMQFLKEDFDKIDVGAILSQVAAKMQSSACDDDEDDDGDAFEFEDADDEDDGADDEGDAADDEDDADDDDGEED